MNNVVWDRLRDIATAVMYAAEGQDLETVLEGIANISRELANAHYAALGIPDGRGGLRFFKTSGITPEQVSQIAHLPEGRGLLGAIMHEQKAILLDDIQTDARSVGFPANHPPMRSFLGVPIKLGRQLFGMLYLCDKANGQPFDATDQALIETLAGYAALAIVGAEYSERVRRLSLLEERERIAMELHDGIIQSLYGMGMQLSILKMDEQIAPQALEPIIQHLDSVIEEIRRFIRGLNNAQSQKTIRQCLAEIPMRLYAPDSIAFRIDAEETMPPFSMAVFESICLIVNEAVSNTIRHSGASQVVLKAWQNDGHFNILVSDDGRGFHANQPEQTGLGLRNMQHRARLYGGSVSIDSQIGAGTRVTIEIPLWSMM